ncbi:BREX-1 system adenine-specific DNA-methyltransferase PglX [Pseudohongiella sp.]|uniref:BREX-1 system adenine-specific DNA-methyltransferase PglX n=1 Tax=marine sediment metagenome TaxID=412755 RepID=A0A0F9Z374_9ZZZZ|nr:BREX-1 system adenine-specific DNA-methyltransferase PglX [Pseudohongiella sp.]HDZ09176.1 BREX-1 system adenine-specific DNA-methyltransferase PglX [Pseudohongiella sp.]
MSQEQSKDISQYFFRASAADFMKIPGNPMAYWATPADRRIFEHKNTLGMVAYPRQGMATTNNDLFLRRWFEVSASKSKFDCSDTDECIFSGAKWFPYNKGGSFRRWYGNNEYLVNFENNGKTICDYIDNTPGVKVGSNGRVINREHYFKPSVTWSFVSSSYLGVRKSDIGFIFDVGGSSSFPPPDLINSVTGFLCCKVAFHLMKAMNPTLNFQVGNIAQLPLLQVPACDQIVKKLVELGRQDWDYFETSWNFKALHLFNCVIHQSKIFETYHGIRSLWLAKTLEMKALEEKNNSLFIGAYGLQDELTPVVPLEEITLNCNPHYRYGINRSEEELETLLQCDTIKELVSYAIGCMMGRYSLDKPGLILANQGETLQDYLKQIPSPRFAPDDDAILPLTDQEWFADDATNRFCEFMRIAWPAPEDASTQQKEQHLQQNLDFVTESLCLHAIKPKRGESAPDTIRRYLSTQFFKDHLRTYKKRPIYWLFSSGKHKAFECLVYLHRYNEGILSRMRTEYVIPLSAKLSIYAEKLEKDRDASPSAAETKRLEKELVTLHKQQAELAEFDEKLRHYADQRISLDLDDGVKVNYAKFGDLLAEVKSVTGTKE